MIPAAVADSWFFWLAIIDGLAGVYVLPAVIGIARRWQAAIERSPTWRRFPGTVLPGTPPATVQPEVMLARISLLAQEPRLALRW